MHKTIRNVLSIGLLSSALTSLPVLADDYVIDTKGAHSAISFEISHLGIGLVNGRFNTFSGSFSYDEANPAASVVNVKIDTSSVDSNHAERDKHLRSDDFLDVKKFPEAQFVSTGFSDKGNGKAMLEGDLTLHGVTKAVSIEVDHLGNGEDPWGGYRRGFRGQTQIGLADFGITKNLGPASKEVSLMISIEGIRQ